MPGFDLFVVHVDADVAEKRYADVGTEFAVLAAQHGWPPLPDSLPCPPASGSADAMRACLLSWAGLQALGPKTVLCVPSKTVEAWLTATVFDDGHALLTNLECNLNLEGQLKALPKAQRIKKTTRDYQTHAQNITRAWTDVRQRCSQAERFSIELKAVAG